MAEPATRASMALLDEIKREWRRDTGGPSPDSFIAAIGDVWERAAIIVANHLGEIERQAAAQAEARIDVERLVEAIREHVFDLPIGEDVTYSRGYSAGIASARDAAPDIAAEYLALSKGSGGEG